MVFCSYCYKEEGLSKCGKCYKRHYCSRECQRQDWKTGHKVYCGIAGDIGVDFDVRTADDDKGMGVFALRDFDRNEKIMMERPILFNPNPITATVPESAKDKVDDLVPKGGSLLQTIARNSMSCSDDGRISGLFITMSRVNHDCVGNSDHYFNRRRGVKILVASQNIRRGEEITFSYCGGNLPSTERRRILREQYKFTCTCSACQDEDSEADLDHIQELDDSLLELGSTGRVTQAIRKGQRLLQLYEKYSMSSWLYHRTYYDLFQVAVTKRSTLKDAKMYIRKAHEAVSSFMSDDQEESVVKMKVLADSPESHRNYLLLG